MKKTKMACGFLLLLAVLLVPTVFAGEVRLAVASNFVHTTRVLVDEFSAQQSHRVLTSFGSTGKLFAQISNGAPFDVFLSADVERPKRLEENGSAVVGSRFTYAIGQLTLWASSKSNLSGDCRVLLNRADFRRLAIANPKTAPYGLATQQTLRRLGLWERYKSRLVRGENIAQTFQFVVTGNASLGFVALSQVKRTKKGVCRWDVPQDYHEPIKQQTVLLKRGATNTAAQAFMRFLQSEKAKSLIRRAGYAL